MKRLLIFPLTLGIACALWLPISLLEAMLGTWLSLMTGSFAQFSEKLNFMLLPIIEESSLPSFIFGFVAALITMLIRRKTRARHTDFSARFRASLVWLFCYATLIILSNEAVIYCALARFKSSRIEPPSFLEHFAFLLPIFLNLWVVIFAVGHTFGSSTILSPRFFGERLRAISRSSEQP